MVSTAGLLRALVRGYQLLLRPLLPAGCRYHPSCSHYAREALARHGAWTGTRLAIARLARCHPWSDGGYDPVPDRVEGRRPDGRRAAAAPRFH